MLIGGPLRTVAALDKQINKKKNVTPAAPTKNELDFIFIRP